MGNIIVSLDSNLEVVYFLYDKVTGTESMVTLEEGYMPPKDGGVPCVSLPIILKSNTGHDDATPELLYHLITILPDSLHTYHPDLGICTFSTAIERLGLEGCIGLNDRGHEYGALFELPLIYQS